MPAELERIKSDLPGRVLHHSFQSDPSLFFSGADIAICPSIYQEPSPNVVFEAKWFGLPSVVFNVGGIPELVSHQIDGFICQEISAQSLADGIEYFLKNESVRRTAGVAARKSIDDRFGLKRFEKQWSEVLDMEYADE